MHFSCIMNYICFAHLPAFITLSIYQWYTNLADKGLLKKSLRLWSMSLNVLVLFIWMLLMVHSLCSGLRMSWQGLCGMSALCICQENRRLSSPLLSQISQLPWCINLYLILSFLGRAAQCGARVFVCIACLVKPCFPRNVVDHWCWMSCFFLTACGFGG